MKRIFLFLALLAGSLCVRAGGTIVEQGSAKTVNGIGGYCEIACAFAKGDKVTIDAKASKQLQMMLVIGYPRQVFGRVKDTKKVSYSFTVPEESIVIFRFVSDRGGTNSVAYVITREPAPDGPQEYNTKVIWEKPRDRAGELIPRQAGD